jgi:uncharacterized integral membrane protein
MWLLTVLLLFVFIDIGIDTVEVKYLQNKLSYWGEHVSVTGFRALGGALNLKYEKNNLSLLQPCSNIL